MNGEFPDIRKAVIVAYKDNTLQKAINNFVIPVNPESYSQNFKVKYESNQGQAQEGTNLRYGSTAPERLQLEFVLDGTGTIEEYVYEGFSVQEQVKHFLEVAYDMNGDNHRPNFLIVYWGALTFAGALESVDIQYPLFDPDGKPLRAKLNATFVQDLEQSLRQRLEAKKSPDLTHIRRLKAGDRLDLMTYERYDNSKFVLQVAKVNGLTTFRNVAEGTELIFPPFNKTEV